MRSFENNGDSPKRKDIPSSRSGRRSPFVIWHVERIERHGPGVSVRWLDAEGRPVLAYSLGSHIKYKSKYLFKYLIYPAYHHGIWGLISMSFTFYEMCIAITFDFLMV